MARSSFSIYSDYGTHWLPQIITNLSPLLFKNKHTQTTKWHPQLQSSTDKTHLSTEWPTSSGPLRTTSSYSKPHWSTNASYWTLPSCHLAGPGIMQPSLMEPSWKPWCLAEQIQHQPLSMQHGLLDSITARHGWETTTLVWTYKLLLGTCYQTSSKALMSHHQPSTTGSSRQQLMPIFKEMPLSLPSMTSGNEHWNQISGRPSLNRGISTLTKN